MKRIVLIAFLVVGLVMGFGGNLFFNGQEAVSAVSDCVTVPTAFYLDPPNQFVKTTFVYQEQMADGTTWYAYGKGSVFSRDPRPGDMLFLKNANEESFKIRVVQVFQVPPGSKTEGVWLEFENLTPVRGQPLTGPGFVTVRK